MWLSVDMARSSILLVGGNSSGRSCGLMRSDSGSSRGSLNSSSGRGFKSSGSWFLSTVAVGSATYDLKLQ
jgi:hypothetical protein